MVTEDVTVEILRAIRDEIRSTKEVLGERIDQTNQRIDQTNQRLDETNGAFASLARRQVEMEVRISTELVALGQTSLEIRDLLRDRLDVRNRVDKLEQRMDAVERTLDQP